MNARLESLVVDFFDKRLIRKKGILHNDHIKSVYPDINEPIACWDGLLIANPSYVHEVVAYKRPASVVVECEPKTYSFGRASHTRLYFDISDEITLKQQFLGPCKQRHPHEYAMQSFSLIKSLSDYLVSQANT